MLALLLTCRPLFKPWVLHQLGKQGLPFELRVFDDCSKPTWEGAIRPTNRMQLSLGEKRQALLETVDQPFCWFDDDDWLPKERFAMAEKFPDVDAVGCQTGVFVDVKTLQTRILSTGERVVFNGAVFSPQCAKHKFQPLNRGEDTMWLQAVLRDATVVSSPIMQHAWLSHDGNVTGRRGSMTFSGPRFARLDAWEREFISRIPTA